MEEAKTPKPFSWLEDKKFVRFDYNRIWNFCKFHNIPFKLANENDLDGGHFTGSEFDIKMLEYGLVRLGVNWYISKASMILIRYDEIKNTIDKLILNRPEIIRKAYENGKCNYINPRSEAFENEIEAYNELYELILLELEYSLFISTGSLSIYIDALDLMLDYYENKIK